MALSNLNTVKGVIVFVCSSPHINNLKGPNFSNGWLSSNPWFIQIRWLK